MKKVIIVLGPTAVGKTKTGIELAKRFATEIISGDSVQVYKGLDIGSAKVTEEEASGIKHHLIDILEPNETYSVCDFQKASRELMEKLDIPIIVGGFILELIELNNINVILQEISLLSYIFAFLLTFAVSMIALKLTIRFLKKQKFIVFSVYTFLMFVVTFVFNFII